jgi:hypothetical protein
MASRRRTQISKRAGLVLVAGVVTLSSLGAEIGVAGSATANPAHHGCFGTEVIADEFARGWHASPILNETVPPAASPSCG